MKRFLFMATAMAVSMVLTAATVTKEEARQKALQFLTEKRGQAAASRGLQPVQLQDGLSTGQLHIFNVGQLGGFIIVSGDDCTGDAILGYADSGNIEADNMPDNLRAWLQGYADEISWMQAHGIRCEATAASRAMSSSTVRRSVSPLLATQWNQESPYYNYCPVILYKYSDGSSKLEHATAGCVATATAQIMYYHGKKAGKPTEMKKNVPAYQSTKEPLFDKWANEEHTSFVPTYDIAEKPARTFDWSKFSATYPSDDATANEEVARLVEYIGASVKMQYAASSSSSTADVPGALHEYFGYDADIKNASRSNYNYHEWINLIYQELTENGPVLFGGQSMGGGHAFVIDGYLQDDLFHINWGWGGLSDGYFRMSVLTPSNQGPGSSTSTDGYNYEQDIMLNVKPVDDGISSSVDTRLTVTTFASEFTSYQRTNNSNFGTYKDDVLYQGVKVDYKLHNLTGRKDNFDYGFALYQNDQMVELLHNDSYENLEYKSYYTGSLYLQFGKDMADGEYKIISVSRKTGTDTWYPSEESDQYYISATVSGNTLTMENVALDKTVNLQASLSLKGEATAGQASTVIARMTNSGYRYSGKVQLAYVVNNEAYLLAVSHMDVEHGAEKEAFEIEFTPKESGQMTIVLFDKDNKVIAGSRTTVTIAAAPEVSKGSLAVTGMTLKNGDAQAQEVYGTTVKAGLTIQNNGKTNHNNGIRVMLFHWVFNGSGFTGSMVQMKDYDLEIAAGEQTTLDIELGGMEIGQTNYGLGYFYTDNQEISYSNVFFKSVHGIDIYYANGQTETIRISNPLTVAEDALAVDLANASNIAVTPNSNPNTLYYVGDGVTGLDGKNVVKDQTTALLTINDSYGFYAPQAFTAAQAVYTRTFTQATDGADGWSTIVLPFDVKEVKQGNRSIDWFRSSTDDNKDFWVKEYVSDNSSAINFDYAEKIEANIPYIIAIPDNKLGEGKDLTGKEITFTGADVTIASNAVACLSGNFFRFTGSMVKEELTDSYVLNDKGSAFVKQQGAVNPFRAYFTASQTSDVKELTIAPEKIVPVGITTVESDTKTGNNSIYLLDGRRVKQLQKGINIINGKKVMR